MNIYITKFIKFLKGKGKDFVSNYIIQCIIAWIIHFYIFFVYKTSKIIRKGTFNEVVENVKENKNGLAVFGWHGRIFTFYMEYPDFLKSIINSKNKNVYVLSSTSRDGKIGVELSKSFGIMSILGSTINHKKGSSKNKHSLSALRNIMKILSLKSILIFTPDGPRGPAHKINSSVANIAQKTNSIILSVSFSYKRKIQFKTWDLFQFPLPFNKIIIEYGKLIKINENDDVNKINTQMELELNNNTKNNDLLIKNY